MSERIKWKLGKSQDNSDLSHKMNKWLLWTLIWLWTIVLLGWAWAVITKTWVIPNRFDIELLCPNSCLPGYEMIYGHCHKVWWPRRWAWWCLNCEYYDAAEECSKYYKMPNVKWYTQEGYNAWLDENYEKYIDSNVENSGNNWGRKYFIHSRSDDLSKNTYYEDWLNEKFDWYQEALKEYEKHQNGCMHYKQVDKPIIYLYPTQETKINVRLWNADNLSHTYPKYNREKWWDVVAQPNWDLEDIDTWRKLYALYREWVNDNVSTFNEWFVVKWKDTIPFLEEKLPILWLNEREAEEFIVYWLPQMENNERNLIRFQTITEQDKNMPLNITPTPDTVIRVMMDRKSIDELINIPEQQLTTPERKWFTVVEWWGSQIL